jgi:hypothetical protein
MGTKIKFKKSELMQIIQEEINLQENKKRRMISESCKSESTSLTEVRELMSAYYRNAGGFPPNIFKLSILFPILERCGLREIVEDYKLAKEGKLLEEDGSPKDPMGLLEKVKQAIDEIQSGELY